MRTGGQKRLATLATLHTHQPTEPVCIRGRKVRKEAVLEPAATLPPRPSPAAWLLLRPEAGAGSELPLGPSWEFWTLQ